MQKIQRGTFERAKMSSMDESRYCSYGNSLFARSIELVTVNGVGYICYYANTLDNNRDALYGYSYCKGPKTVLEAEFQSFEEYAAKYYANNYTVAGGF